MSAAQKQHSQNSARYAGLKPWQPGQSGNPAGRPKGSRDKLKSGFLDDAAADWAENGKEAFRKLAENNPHDYLRLMAEVAQVNEQRRETTVIDARPVFDLGSVLGRIAAGSPTAGLPGTVLNGSLLPAALHPEADGRGEAMDSGSLPGSAGEPE